MSIFPVVKNQKLIRASGSRLPSMTLTRMVQDGRLERVTRGIYAIKSEDGDIPNELSVVALRVPRCVICLASALQFHDLSTWISPDIWICIEQNQRPPRVDWPPLRVTYAAKKFLGVGVEEHEMSGVPVKITGPARTVVDCFKWRSTVGMEVALESLRAYLRRYPNGRRELMEIAAACRMARVMMPYVEAMS